MNKIEELLNLKIVMLDGAMGTQLQSRGLKPGEIPELWNLTHPDDVKAVHSSYFDAGCDLVLANTFGANPVKYHGKTPLKDVISAGVSLARAAAPQGGLVALDVGPTGRLLQPHGDFSFDAAYDAFAEQICLGTAAGADCVVIETINDTYELKAALLAAKENSTLPVLATVALSEDGKLLTGADVDCLAALFAALRPDAVGFNCGLGPDRLLPFVERLAARVRQPIIVKANAGLPRVAGEATIFDVGPEQFATEMIACVHAGATLVGGCCGTTPEHIRVLSAALQSLSPRPVRSVPEILPTVATSYSRCVELPMDDSIIIGERINPTGKRKLREAYQIGDMGYVLREAIAQVEAGAHVLDVNAGVPGLDESKVLCATVEAIQGVTDVPLQIDTSDPAALEAALRHYNGKALVNSVNGKQEVMDAVFPLVAKYGGVLVALTLDEQGIPPTAEGRVAVARRILTEGVKYGLLPEDFIVDVLTLAVSADAGSANLILEALWRVRKELGVRTVLGVSNISFGLPSRPALNASFYTLALGQGLTSAIVNPLAPEMMTAYHAWRALTGHDTACENWIGVGEHVSSAVSVSATTVPTLRDTIVHGLKADASAFAKSLLQQGQAPMEIVDGEIVPALETVGKGFETGKIFLPQLLMAAEAASASFEVLRTALAQLDSPVVSKGPIILATVKGDIHDIGKNIVRALLENYGFRVIDLGRDVSPETIVETAMRERCKLVGLSALMTTTVVYMKETVARLSQADPSVKTFVGGAVLTPAYASEIGATWYAKDAMASVRIAEAFFEPRGV